MSPTGQRPAGDLQRRTRGCASCKDLTLSPPLGGLAKAGFTLANFGAAVGAAAISGAVTGAVATGIYGGKFGKNVGFGALGGAITAAVVYGEMAAWNALNGNSGAQTASSDTRRLQFAAAEGISDTMSDARPDYGSARESRSTFYDNFANVMLRAGSFMVAAELMETGHFLIIGGLKAMAIGGPVGLAVGGAVTTLGVAVTGLGAVVGANAAGIHNTLGLPDLGFPKFGR